MKIALIFQAPSSSLGLGYTHLRAFGPRKEVWLLLIRAEILEMEGNRVSKELIAEKQIAGEEFIGTAVALIPPIPREGE